MARGMQECVPGCARAIPRWHWRHGRCVEGAGMLDVKLGAWLQTPHAPDCYPTACRFCHWPQPAYFKADGTWVRVQGFVCLPAACQEGNDSNSTSTPCCSIPAPPGALPDQFHLAGHAHPSGQRAHGARHAAARGCAEGVEGRHAASWPAHRSTQWCVATFATHCCPAGGHAAHFANVLQRSPFFRWGWRLVHAPLHAWQRP